MPRGVGDFQETGLEVGEFRWEIMSSYLKLKYGAGADTVDITVLEDRMQSCDDVQLHLLAARSSKKM